MELTASSYGLSLLAGVLSTPSPCVLPLVPILMGSAAGAHRLGPFALVGGLILSFNFLLILILRLSRMLCENFLSQMITLYFI